MAPSDLTILVTGSAGILGRRLTPILAEDHRVIASIHRNELKLAHPATLEVKKCNLTDVDAAARLIDETKPDIVINCAAMTDVDGCEENPVLAESVNSGVVKNLLRAINREVTYFVQISTDYVFDGKAGPYPENSAANPVNIYGQTKLDGEAVARSWEGRSLVVRTSALYDCHSTENANLFASTYNRLHDGKPVSAASDLYCNPIWAANLARALKEAVEKQIRGILNIAGPAYLSRYQFSMAIAEHYEFPRGLVKRLSLAELNRKAQRPQRAGVDISLASKVLDTKLLSPAEVFSVSDFNPD
jgi:dTDP-4-dehydrorhamnose reductase